MRADAFPTDRTHARATGGSLPWLGGLAAFLLIGLFAWFGDLYLYVGDDAGITLRYSERIAEGKGFSYNDGEAVNGSSNPLYVLCEALLLFLGLSSEHTIRGIATLCLATAAGVLFATFARFYSLGAAVFAVLALIAFDQPLAEAFDGLETPLVFLFAALLFRALHSGGQLLPGVVLGLLVANKLDGGLAAIAYSIVYVVRHRRLPFVAALVAVLAASPVFLYLLVNFGSVFPNSMKTKLAWHAQLWDMDPLWMHKFLTLGTFRVLYWGAWVSMLWMPFARKLRGSAPIAVVQVWFLVHLVVYGTLNLGGPTPWYSASPMMNSVILSSFLVHALSHAVLERSAGRLPRLKLPDVAPPRARIVSAALILVLAGLAAFWSGEIAARLRPPAIAHACPPSTSFELGRQAGGAWLRKHTSGTELFMSYCGLPAYEYEGPYYDMAELNVDRDVERINRAVYELVGPEPGESPLKPVHTGRILVATFLYDSAGERHSLYARRDSEIVGKGLHHLVFPMPAVWTNREREGEPRARIAKNRNDVYLPSQGPAYFHLTSPARLSMKFTPRLVRKKLAPALAGDAVRLTILVNGNELWSGEVDAAGEQAPIEVHVQEENPARRYEFELRVRYTGSEDPRELMLAMQDTLIHAGELLQAEDFKLMFERSRQRVEYVASKGLPNRTFDR